MSMYKTVLPSANPDAGRKLVIGLVDVTHKLRTNVNCEYRTSAKGGISDPKGLLFPEMSEEVLARAREEAGTVVY